ncbi:MAG: PAC2 family protein [Myxococcota bacterium]|nr:PAC2 family protein [Myxococcota bacterium]
MAGPLRFEVRPALSNPALVLAFEGWNDAGEASTTAAGYIANQIQAVPLAEIDPEEYYDFTVRRPEVDVEAGRVRSLEWPVTRFRFGSADADSDLVVGVGVEPHLRWRHFGDQVVELVETLGIRRVALVGAFLGDVLYSLPVRVSCVGSRPERLEALGVETTSYQGPTGIVGVLAERLRDTDCEVASFWAGLPHYIHVSPNPRGALALVEALGAFLGLRIDLAPLRSAAAECEQRVSDMVAADDELAEYVRQLKRREFAQ